MWQKLKAVQNNCDIFFYYTLFFFFLQKGLKPVSFSSLPSQGFLQQLRQIAGRMSSGGPRGAGLGIKLLIGAGALAYGVKEATYTGNTVAITFHRSLCTITQLIEIHLFVIIAFRILNEAEKCLDIHTEYSI